MSADNVELEEVEDFLALLKALNISIRKICSIVASEEPCVNEAEVKTKSETFRKRLGRKSISRFELTLMQDILSQQPEFIESNMVNVSIKKDLFKDSSFEKSISSAFKSLHLK